MVVGKRYMPFIKIKRIRISLINNTIMKILKHLLTALLLMVATVAMAHDFEVGGIYYDILSEEEKTVEVTYRGYSYSNYSILINS